MKRVFVPLMLMAALCSRAQTPNETPGTLPSVIPPSPEVSSIVKAGNTSAGLFTGSANVNIPLYELSVGSLKIPISIGYSTNGTKTNEIPSRVGLNWSLVAGGMISRVVHDEQDDGASTIKLTNPDFNNYNSTLETYLAQANIENYDTESDEYSFSVNGMSGKFYFDDNGAAHVADHNNVTITKTGNIFILTAGDGTQYKFGDGLMYEKTKDVKTAGNPRANKVKTTAWFLTKITSPDGDEINFTYSPISTKTNQGPYQSVILKKYSALPPMPEYPDCAYMCEGSWSNVAYTKIDYDSYYLSQISTSDGQQVYLVYQDRPDASGDNRLLYLNVYTTNSGSASPILRRYKFEYDDRPVGNDLNQRFFLKKVIQSSNETTPKTLTHEFQYNDPASLASQESLAQDYYGYSKGSSVIFGDFFPRPINYTEYENGSMGVDRTPNFEATKAGTLKKVIYPTGGYEEFTYEPHTIVQNLSTETYSGSYNISVTGGGTGNGPHGACDQTTNTHPFSLTHPQLKLNFVTEWNPGGPPPGDPNACNADGIHFLSYFEIWDMITNQRVFEARHKYYQGNEYVIQLEPGVPYEARLKANGLSTHAYVNFQFNPVVQTSFTNIPVCGLRVKKIDAFDPLTNQTITRYYKYASLQTPDRSSGVGVLRPSFESVYRRGGICYNLPPPTIGAAIAECANTFLQVSASAVSGAYSFNGSPIAYTHVIETTDEQMTNGGIEHKFYAVNNPHMPGPVLGYEVAGTANTSAVPDMNGTELETKVFKKQGSAFITLKHTQNNYVWDNRVGGSKVNYAIRKRWDPPPYNPVTFSAYDRVRGYDVNSYLHLYRWWYLATSTTTEYDQNGTNPVVKTVNYTYGNTAHLQPTQVTTTGSNNETITQVMKYPHDFAGAMYTAMISKNIITPVIESTTTNGADPVSAVKNEYSTWTVGSNTFYKPQTVKVSSGNNPPEDRLRYYSYDNGGNPLELSKEGDNHIAYIWNYKKTYPVAEVKNAAYNEIAYTSFEGDEYGRWTLVSGTPVGGGITGKMYLSGSLSLTLTNTAKAYVVTLWTKSDVSVNGSSGTLLMTKGAWSLYRWNISAGTGSVSVQGAEMDEVRLYPAGAQMTTYTYGPYVGLSSACDVNNLISYYYYDGFNRLTLIKDIDNNILKKVCYNYAGQAEDCNAEPGNNICTNTAANWQNLPDTRCQKDPATGLNTGHLEQLRHDINTCSPTYGLAEWYDLGMNTEACPMTENVSLTSTNYVGYTGFTAVYTSIGTGAVYTFNVSSSSGSQSLGQLPEGSYNLTISKAGNNVMLLFGSGCSYQSGMSATFNNIYVSGTTCKNISIDYDF